MPVAILSVSDKTGVAELGRALTAAGWTLVSTGGTARTLRDAGLAVRDVSDLTGFPEMLDGRVKTLHPAVHGGVLARRADAGHMASLREHEIAPVDLVVVNLYPFRETAARERATPEEIIEQIDIGGPALLRSAAKNFESVTVVCDPGDYERVARMVTDSAPEPGAALALRRELAGKVYAHTAAYDASIAAWFAGGCGGDPLPGRLALSLTRAQTLRYGENPGQRAAFYVDSPGAGLAGLRQIGGRELSFNNLLDLDGALLAVEALGEDTACAIVKHTTPCGLAVGPTALDAYRRALACDPVSAFGSVIAFNVPVEGDTAAAVAELFVECVVGPAFSNEALAILARKKNLRVLVGSASWAPGSLDFKRVRGGLLAQERPAALTPPAEWRVATRRAPSEAEWHDLEFAWRAVGAVKSNAIVLVRDGATIGIGAGQMSRVDSSYLAAYKAQQAGHDPAGSTLGSDAYFPFRDGVDQAAEAGVTAIVQPGGSVRDGEVIAAADEHGMAMVFTGHRQFRH